MSLLPVESAQYTAIIDGILRSSDLQTISAKKIRKELQAALDQDISDKKGPISDLIIERFNHFEAQAQPTKSAKQESTPASSSRNSADIKPSHSPSDSDQDAPPKKKVKKEKGAVDDAKLAAMLQAQENRTGRATRGAGTKKGIVKKSVKAKRKAKSASKIKATDDSDVELGSDGEVKEKPKKGGFHKQYHLSAPLADLVGEPTLSRPQVVKKIWEYIKARDLQDPSDKRQILCDDKLQLVFKVDKVHMFTMNKILSKQLYDVEEA
ncbi:related to UAF30-subunit of RNA polymerase I transcription factor [Rhynchosporium agropyri]|uniref:Related to UAF30-subunit of RNA polymerase I transcription factor n=1 Tax=Rhynchosporium agropyri TaxID=914238 RepID=A0A1E1K8H9_9HELO|nr:related to UAF30-subunit of RNA polymerase I transcription factor [Rhynchosporium agropyri]